MGFKYNSYDGKDTWRNTDENGHTENKGSAKYDENGTMIRWDNYPPVTDQPGYHHHEWQKQNEDGSYEYHHEIHKDH